jgi:hypothetical protein
VQDFEIVENFVFNNGNHGIWIGVSSWERGLVHANWAIGNGALFTGHGIYIQGISYLEVTDNRCYDNNLDGICLDPPLCNYNYLEGNICHGNGRYGININNVACTGTIVRFNYLLGNATGCINDVGTDTRLPEVTVVVSDPDGNIGRHAAIVLTDGVDVTSRFEIKIPSDFQELVRARIILVPGGTGNLRRSVNTEFGKICADEAYNTHTDSIAAGEVAVTLNELECIDVAAAFTGIAQNDLVGLEFTRHGSHANDTVNANCYLLAFNMQYV